MENVLITGCNGFSGRALARRLKGEGRMRVVGCDLGDPCAGNSLDEMVRLDLRDAGKVEKVVKAQRPDMVFHLAGLFRGEERDLYEVNFMGGVRLLEALRSHAPQARIVVIGSAAEYGFVPEEGMPIVEEAPCRPAGGYGISKHALTLTTLDYARRLGMRAVVARPFNLIGAGTPEGLVAGALIARLKRALADGSPAISVGNLDTERDFVAIEDAVEAYLRMARGEQWGEVFNVCSGVPVSIRRLAEMLLGKAPRPVSLVVDPALVRPGDVRVVYGSYEKARRLLGFRPSVPLEDALASAWQYPVGGSLAA